MPWKCTAKYAGPSEYNECKLQEFQIKHTHGAWIFDSLWSICPRFRKFHFRHPELGANISRWRTMFSPWKTHNRNNSQFRIYSNEEEPKHVRQSQVEDFKSRFWKVKWKWNGKWKMEDGKCQSTSRYLAHLKDTFCMASSKGHGGGQSHPRLVFHRSPTSTGQHSYKLADNQSLAETDSNSPQTMPPHQRPSSPTTHRWPGGQWPWSAGRDLRGWTASRDGDGVCWMRLIRERGWN